MMTIPLLSELCTLLGCERDRLLGNVKGLQQQIMRQEELLAQRDKKISTMELQAETPAMDKDCGLTPEEAKKYRDTAKRLYGLSDEVDLDSDAIISAGDDPGVYVAAWVWVPNAELEG